MKRIISCFLASICLCMILSGCSNKHGSEMITEARDLTTSQISVNPSKNDYGAPAYELLKQIQSDYPGRIAGAEKEKEMALSLTANIAKECSNYCTIALITRDSKVMLKILQAML